MRTLLLYPRLLSLPVVSLSLLLASLLFLGVELPRFESPERGALISTAPVEPDELRQPVLRVPQDYPTIQAALDAALTEVGAAPAATVLVAAGVYRENLVISKHGLVLRGEGAEKTIIESAKVDLPVILMLSEATVQGVTVRGARGWSGCGICVFGGFDEFAIVSNIVEDNFRYGIYVEGRHFGSIANNIIRNNGRNPDSPTQWEGLYLRQVGNTVMGTGIFLRNNTIENDIVSIQSAYWVRLIKNVFRNASVGTSESAQISFWQNLFEKSVISVSDETRRFLLHSIEEYRVMIVSNTFREGGIKLSATEFYVRGNRIEQSKSDGIFIWGTSLHDKLFLAQGREPRRVVEGNIVVESARYGLSIDFSLDLLTLCRNNQIRNNRAGDYAVDSQPSEALKQKCEGN